MPPAYRFLDTWLVQESVERVYETIGDVVSYDRWWTDFVIRSTGDAGEPRPGKHRKK